MKDDELKDSIREEVRNQLKEEMNQNTALSPVLAPIQSTPAVAGVEPGPEPSANYESAPEGQVPSSECEWVQYEKSQYNASEYLESEWDHKSWMLSTKFYDKPVIKLHELVLKELSLSNLPDAELALIYSIKMDCIEEMLSMGFTDLAKQLLIHMLFRLRLNTSVEGINMIGQYGTSTMTMNVDRSDMKRQILEDQEQDKSPKLGLGGFVGKIRGKKQ